ncbi:MAG: SnoaL-like domain-containing protein [Acidobacteria bacterium]|nr:SnoaL-like domain-containing protein [Acidobacteriota bacterium]
MNTTQREARLNIVKAHLDAECQHDLDAIMATFSAQPGFALNGMELSGAEVVRGVYDGFGFGEQGSFADIKLEVQQQYVGDDSVTTEMMFRATHAGEWQGIAATGRAVAVPLCAIFTFDANNQVASERVYFDAATVLQQIGALG